MFSGINLAVREAADVSVCLHETDNASANEKLYAHRAHAADRDGGRGMLEWMLCHCHQNHIVQSTLLASMGENMLSRLYSLTLFLKTGGYWLRLRQAMRRWIRETVIIRNGWPSPDARLFQQELLDYMGCHCTLVDQAREPDGLDDRHWLGQWVDDDDDDDDGAANDSEEAASGGKRRASRASRARLLFAAAFNGELWEQQPIYYTKGEPVDLQSIGLQMIHAMAELAFRKTTTPTANKWTKLGPCMDNLVLGICCHDFMFPCFRMAFGRMQFEKFDDNGHDAALIADLGWQAVSGKRCRHSLDFLGSLSVKLRIIVLAITLEPVRYLLSFFLSAGKDVIHPAKPPALLDALLPEQSPLTIAQQYQASLLLGGGGGQPTVDADLPENAMLLPRADVCRVPRCIEAHSAIGLVDLSLDVPTASEAVA